MLQNIKNNTKEHRTTELTSDGNSLNNYMISKAEPFPLTEDISMEFRDSAHFEGAMTHARQKTADLRDTLEAFKKALAEGDLAGLESMAPISPKSPAKEIPQAVNFHSLVGAQEGSFSSPHVPAREMAIESKWRRSEAPDLLPRVSTQMSMSTSDHQPIIEVSDAESSCDEDLSNNIAKRCFCTNCGTQLAGKFCVQCGQPAPAEIADTIRSNSPGQKVPSVSSDSNPSLPPSVSLPEHDGPDDEIRPSAEFIGAFELQREETERLAKHVRQISGAMMDIGLVQQLNGDQTFETVEKKKRKSSISTKKVSVAVRIPRGKLGMSVAAGDTLVKNVAPAGTADRLGIQPGWRVLRVGGEFVNGDNVASKVRHEATQNVDNGDYTIVFEAPSTKISAAMKVAAPLLSKVTKTEMTKTRKNNNYINRGNSSPELIRGFDDARATGHGAFAFGASNKKMRSPGVTQSVKSNGDKITTTTTVVQCQYADSLTSPSVDSGIGSGSSSPSVEPIEKPKKMSIWQKIKAVGGVKTGPRPPPLGESESEIPVIRNSQDVERVRNSVFEEEGAVTPVPQISGYQSTGFVKVGPAPPPADDYSDSESEELVPIIRTSEDVQLVRGRLVSVGDTPPALLPSDYQSNTSGYQSATFVKVGPAPPPCDSPAGDSDGFTVIRSSADVEKTRGRLLSECETPPSLIKGNCMRAEKQPVEQETQLLVASEQACSENSLKLAHSPDKLLDMKPVTAEAYMQPVQKRKKPSTASSKYLPPWKVALVKNKSSEALCVSKSDELRRIDSKRELLPVDDKPANQVKEFNSSVMLKTPDILDMTSPRRSILNMKVEPLELDNEEAIAVGEMKTENDAIGAAPERLMIETGSTKSKGMPSIEESIPLDNGVSPVLKVVKAESASKGLPVDSMKMPSQWSITSARKSCVIDIFSQDANEKPSTIRAKAAPRPGRVARGMLMSNRSRALHKPTHRRARSTTKPKSLTFDMRLVKPKASNIGKIPGVQVTEVPKTWRFMTLLRKGVCEWKKYLATQEGDDVLSKYQELAWVLDVDHALANEAVLKKKFMLVFQNGVKIMGSHLEKKIHVHLNGKLFNKQRIVILPRN